MEQIKKGEDKKEKNDSQRKTLELLEKKYRKIPAIIALTSLGISSACASSTLRPIDKSIITPEDSEESWLDGLANSEIVRGPDFISEAIKQAAAASTITIYREKRLIGSRSYTIVSGFYAGGLFVAAYHIFHSEDFGYKDMPFTATGSSMDKMTVTAEDFDESLDIAVFRSESERGISPKHYPVIPDEKYFKTQILPRLSKFSLVKLIAADTSTRVTSEYTNIHAVSPLAGIDLAFDDIAVDALMPPGTSGAPLFALILDREQNKWTLLCDELGSPLMIGMIKGFESIGVRDYRKGNTTLQGADAAKVMEEADAEFGRAKIDYLRIAWAPKIHEFLKTGGVALMPPVGTSVLWR